MAHKRISQSSIMLRLILGLILGCTLSVFGYGQEKMPGDLDGNGVIDAVDQQLMRNLLAGNITYRQIAVQNADVNENGRFETMDSAWLLMLEPPFRGGLISCESVGIITKGQADDLLNQIGFGELTPAQYDTNLYRIKYRTVDPWGGVIPASGIMTLPAERSGTLPLFSFQHGSMSLHEEAPSNPDSFHAKAIGIVYSGYGGYVGVGADYLGLGFSPGLHPYVHAETEASACIDLLRAARTAAAEYDVSLTGELFLTGYSQGGHSTMALHREIEERFADEFQLTASAPMAGPYDLSGTMLPYALLFDIPDTDMVIYLPYVLLSYQMLYSLAPSLSDIFLSPYDGLVPGLFDGYHSFGQIANVMPAIPNEALQPDFLDGALNDPEHPLVVASRINNVYRWIPQAPLHMFHSEADTMVPYANAEVAYAWMSQAGADVALTSVSTVLDHEDAAIPCILQSLIWFETLIKNGTD